MCIAHPRQLRLAVRRDRRRASPRVRRRDRREDKPRRVCDGLVDGALRVRRDAQSVGHIARRGRFVGRLRGCCRRAARAGGARVGHGRLGAAARRTLRNRRSEADVRARQPLRARRVRVEPRSDRHAHQDRSRKRRASRRHGRTRSSRFDLQLASGGRLHRRPRPRRAWSARRRDSRGSRPAQRGSTQELRRCGRRVPARRRHRRRCPRAVDRLLDRDLLRRGQCGGEREPRSIRRHPLRNPARR